MSTQTRELTRHLGGAVVLWAEYDDAGGETVEIVALICDNATVMDVAFTLEDRVSGRSRSRTFGPGMGQRVAIPAALRPSFKPGTRLARVANRLTIRSSIPA